MHLYVNETLRRVATKGYYIQIPIQNTIFLTVVFAKLIILNLLKHLKRQRPKPSKGRKLRSPTLSHFDHDWIEMQGKEQEFWCCLYENGGD